MDEYNLESIKEVPRERFDAIVLTVSHNKFKELDFSRLKKENGILYDVKGICTEAVDGKL